MIIDRWEAGKLATARHWILVYGRRKTGKTFLLKRYLNWDVYATVGRSGLCILEAKGRGTRLVPVREGIEEVVHRVNGGGLGVIDEFQRMPEGLWDYIASMRATAEGRLILCGSSLSIARKVFDRRSPLLALFAPFKVDLVSPADAINSFSREFSPREAITWALLARDPWLLGIVEATGSPIDSIRSNLRALASCVSGLVGEIFEEEERRLTRLYDAILRLLALGYWSSRDLAHVLYDAGLLERAEPGVVTGILDQMSHMGLVEKIPLWRTRGARVYYRHRSSLVSLLLYLDEEYGETHTLPSRAEVESRLGLELQFFLGELLAEHKGLKRAYTMLPAGKGDIDIVLTRKGRPAAAYEVKAGAFSRKEARRAVERMKEQGIPRTGLISLAEDPPKVADETLGPEDILRIAEKLARRERSPQAS